VRVKQHEAYSVCGGNYICTKYEVVTPTPRRLPAPSSSRASGLDNHINLSRSAGSTLYTYLSYFPLLVVLSSGSGLVQSACHGSSYPGASRFIVTIIDEFIVKFIELSIYYGVPPTLHEDGWTVSSPQLWGCVETYAIFVKTSRPLRGRLWLKLAQRAYYHQRRDVQVLALKVLVDSNLDPWLLEVDRSPALACTSSSLKDARSELVRQVDRRVRGPLRATTSFPLPPLKISWNSACGCQGFGDIPIGLVKICRLRIF
jgi:hypothetical protein